MGVIPMMTEIIIFLIIVWLGAITKYLFYGKGAVLAVPKPPKKYICPHGKISTLKEYTIKGQKRVLCNYCYNKEGGFSDVHKNDLPRL